MIDKVQFYLQLFSKWAIHADMQKDQSRIQAWASLTIKVPDNDHFQTESNICSWHLVAL